MAHRRLLDKVPQPRAPRADVGEVLAVRVSPRARADRLLGFRPQAADSAARGAGAVLWVQVAVPPEGGRANRALVALVAHAAGVPRRMLALVAGRRSRHKLLRVPAGTTAATTQRTNSLLGPSRNIVIHGIPNAPGTHVR